MSGSRYNEVSFPAGSPVPMAFAGFHPVVRQWFTTEVGEPTTAQLRGWDVDRRAAATR